MGGRAFLQLTIREIVVTLKRFSFWLLLFTFLLPVVYQLYVTQDMLQMIQSMVSPLSYWERNEFWLLSLSYLFWLFFTEFTFLRQDIYGTADLELSAPISLFSMLCIRSISIFLLPLMLLLFLAFLNAWTGKWITILPWKELLFWFFLHFLPMILFCLTVVAGVVLIRGFLPSHFTLLLSFPVWMLSLFLVGSIGGNVTPLSLIYAEITGNPGKVQTIVNPLETPVEILFFMPPISFSRFPEVAVLEKQFYMVKQLAYMGVFLFLIFLFLWLFTRSYHIPNRRKPWLVPLLVTAIFSVFFSYRAYALYKTYWFHPQILAAWEDPKRTGTIYTTPTFRAEEWQRGLSQAALDITEVQSTVSLASECSENRVQIQTSIYIGETRKLKRSEITNPLVRERTELLFSPVVDSESRKEVYSKLIVLSRVSPEVVEEALLRIPRELILSLSPLVEDLEISVAGLPAKYSWRGYSLSIQFPEGVSPPFTVQLRYRMSAFLIARDFEPLLSWGYCGFPFFLKPYAYTGGRTGSLADAQFGFIWPFPTFNIGAFPGSDDRKIFIYDQFLSEVDISGALIRYISRIPNTAISVFYHLEANPEGAHIQWRAAAAPGFYGGNFKDFFPDSRVHIVASEKTVLNENRFKNAIKNIQDFYSYAFQQEMPGVYVTPFDLDMEKLQRMPEMPFWDSFYDTIAARADFRTSFLPFHIFLKFFFFTHQLGFSEREAIDYIQNRYAGSPIEKSRNTRALKVFHQIRAAYLQETEETMNRIRDIILRSDFDAYIQKLQNRDYVIEKDYVDYVFGELPRIPQENVQ